MSPAPLKHAPSARDRTNKKKLSVSRECKKKLLYTLAAWSRGLILPSGARGPGLNSRSSPQTSLSGT